MRELVGSKEERAAAKAERLAARDQTNQVIQAKMQERKDARRSRYSHQGELPTIAQVLSELRAEPLREPLDEQVEVVGETYNIAAIKKVFRGRGLPIPAKGIEVNDAECILVPEPWNEYDVNAVAVTIDGQHVGHLPADLAARYAEPLQEIARSGFLVTGVGRIWAKDDGSGLVRARVTILIPEADLLR